MQIHILKYNLIVELHTQMIYFNTMKATGLNDFTHPCFLSFSSISLPIHSQNCTTCHAFLQ